MEKARTYEGGRSTKGWKRGKKITQIDQVKIGDVIIGVSHQFKAENLYRVTGPEPTNFMAGKILEMRYIQPNGDKGDGHEMAVWPNELMDGRKEYFLATKKPWKPDWTPFDIRHAPKSLIEKIKKMNRAKNDNV
jgi:hypothetical protein